MQDLQQASDSVRCSSSDCGLRSTSLTFVLMSNLRSARRNFGAVMPRISRADGNSKVGDFERSVMMADRERFSLATSSKEGVRC
jgi:hypothetical protein